jgi:hypothetical protein
MIIQCVRDDGSIEHPDGILQIPSIGNNVLAAKSMGEYILNKSKLIDEQIQFIPPYDLELHVGMILLIYDNIFDKYYYVIVDSVQLEYNGKFLSVKGTVKKYVE